MAGNVFQEKAALRRQVEARRRALTSDQVERWGGAVQRNCAALPLFQRAKVVALYAAQSFEVPTWELLSTVKAQGGRAVFPRVVPGTRVLAFHQLARRDEFVTCGKLALLEPSLSAPTVALDEIELFVVPGVAFARDGARLGRGGGYYDATLSAAPRAVAVGVAFECCVVAEVPQAPHDRRVDVLVTELRTMGQSRSS